MDKVRNDNLRRLIVNIVDDIEHTDATWTPLWRTGCEEASVCISMSVIFVARTLGISADDNKISELYDNVPAALMNELKKRGLTTRTEGDVLHILRKVK